MITVFRLLILRLLCSVLLLQVDGFNLFIHVYKLDIVKEELQCIPWSTMEVFEDIEDVWAFFSTVVFTCLDKRFPLRKVSCKYSKRHTPS